MNIILPRVRLNEETKETLTTFPTHLNHYTELNRVKDDYSDYHYPASRASTAVVRSSPGGRSIEVEADTTKPHLKPRVSLDEDLESRSQSDLHLLSFLDVVVISLAFSLGSGHLEKIWKSTSEYGGGVYLTARVITDCCVGVPLVFLEMTLGHFSGLALVQLFQNLRPVFSGIGVLYLIVTSYSALMDASDSMWSVSQLINSSFSPPPLALPEAEPKINSSSAIHMELIDLESTAVIGLAAVWAVVMVLTVPGLRFVKFMSYLVLAASVSLLCALVVGQFSIDSTRVGFSLQDVLKSDWSQLLRFPLWVRVSLDTLLAHRLGTGVYAMIGKEAKPKFNLLTATLITCGFHLLITGAMFVFCGSVDRVSAFGVLSSVPEKLGHPWIVVFYTTVFALNVIGISLVVTLLATSWTTSRWRPVVTVMICGLLFLLGVPFTTPDSRSLHRLISNYSALLPTAAVLLSLLAALNGCRLSGLIRGIEFATKKKKLGLFAQSCFVMSYAVLLPLTLIACLVVCAIHFSAISDGLTQKLVYSLTFTPFVFIIATPLFNACVRCGHCSLSRRLGKLFSSPDRRDWQSVAEERVHYDLPERVAPLHYGHINLACNEAVWNR